MEILLNGAVLAAATTIAVDNGSFFRAGMQVSVKNSNEVILVTAVSGNNLTVVRGFGGTTAANIADNAVLTMIQLVEKKIRLVLMMVFLNLIHLKITFRL